MIKTYINLHNLRKCELSCIYICKLVSKSNWSKNTHDFIRMSKR